MKTNKLKKAKNPNVSQLKKAPVKRVLSTKQAELVAQTINALILCDTQKQACEMLGINNSTIHRRLANYPEIKAGVDLALNEMKQNAIKKLRAGVVGYVGNIQTLATESNSDNVKLQANLELLDRSGIQKPKDNTNIQVNVLNQMKEQSKDYDI